MALVTGTLAEPALRRVAGEIEAGGRVRVQVVVLQIQVAALMTTDWVLRKLQLPEPPEAPPPDAAAEAHKTRDCGVPPSRGTRLGAGSSWGGAEGTKGERFDRIILPGRCKGDLRALAEKWGVPVERGPEDLHDLPEYFGGRAAAGGEYGRYDLEILAEINDGPRVSMERLVAMAEAYRADGADVIDLGCDPQADRPAWAGVGDAVRALRERGFRVSVDSFHPEEVAAAVRAGAELVLSVNSANRHLAPDWGCEVVVIPDSPRKLTRDDLAGLDETVEFLTRRNVPFRIDPIVEPIGFGFAASLGRYLEVRRRYPEARMMMGVGNLTEMTEVDSAGVNAILAGFCQELGITSVLTTQVIPWARTSVRELDVARRLMYAAVSRQRVPKHLDSRLVQLRDAKVRRVEARELEELARRLTDRNIRLFTDVQTGRIHAMNKDFHVTGDDPFVLFDQMGISDPSHAFYLGFEMAKALTALTLGKNYTQDQALRWGHLTREEVSHHGRRTKDRMNHKDTPRKDTKKKEHEEE